MSATAKSIFEKKIKREKVVVLTAYDYPAAQILDSVGVDIVLVGDSVGMVLLGYDSTRPVTMEEMLHHTKAVSRGVKNALVVSDMPFGSYDTTELALQNAKRFISEGGARAVKLEGGKRIEKQVGALIAAGISVMGHVGMTPQTAKEFKVQGKDKLQADAIIQDATVLDRLGVFSMVVECVPAALGAEITKCVKCPTIGIGAGAGTDGQVLVLNDMLGYQGKVQPKFVRKYANFQAEMTQAVHQYRDDVLSGRFPSKEESF